MTRPRIWDGNPETEPDAPYGRCSECGGSLQARDDGVCLDCRSTDAELWWSANEDHIMDERGR